VLTFSLPYGSGSHYKTSLLFCFVLFRRYEASDRQEGTMSLGSVYAGRQWNIQNKPSWINHHEFFVGLCLLVLVSQGVKKKVCMMFWWWPIELFHKNWKYVIVLEEFLSTHQKNLLILEEKIDQIVFTTSKKFKLVMVEMLMTL